MGYINPIIDEDILKTLKKQDSYGFKKLLAEQYLISATQNKCLCLRLADVIGPYDETFRFWKQLIYIEHNLPFLKDNSKTNKMSFVYSRDVVRVILQTIETPYFGVFNLACHERVTIDKL